MSDAEQATTEQTSTDVTPDRGEELIGAGAEIIDVRRPVEFEAGRLAGARNIEMNELQASADSLPGERPILFYCRTGNRSGMAAAAFRDAGYDAYHLTDGITGWAEEGKPLEPEGGEVIAPPPPSA